MNDEIVKIKGTEQEKKLLLDFLQKEKNEFRIRLEDVIDLQEYVKKIVDKAISYVYYDNNKIIGLLIMYANDKKDNISHISFLCVDRDYRGKHMATKLVGKAIETAKNNKMKYVELYTHIDNIIPQKIYEKLGFYKIESFKKDNIHYRKDLI